MRGSRKRKPSMFQAGHESFRNKNVKKTCDSNLCSGDVNSSSSSATSDAEQVFSGPSSGTPGSIMSLRMAKPENYTKTAAITTHFDDHTGNRIINIGKMNDMYNSAISLHSAQHHPCQQLQFNIETEVKWGAGCQLSLKCVNCNYISPMYKLYQEVNTKHAGRKAAAVNLTLQSSLMDTPIGNRRAQLLIAGGLDVPPPARCGMQKTANYVSQKITQLNKTDMASRITEIKNVSKSSEISIAVDGRYNTTTIGHAKKPGQGASQAIAIACETISKHKYIVSAVLQNKLCWTGAWLQNKGMDVDCPSGHEGCTANIARPVPLSEFDMGKDIGTDLALQGALVRYATTDGDARSCKGIEESIKVLHPLWKVERLADPTHVGRSQFRQCNSAKFSTQMFPGKTKIEKSQAQKTLSQDVKARCSLILKELFKDCCGDVQAIKKRLPKILQATILCYSGDCTKCRLNSIVCGGGHTTDWWTRSMFLGSNNLTVFNMTEQDKTILSELLKIRLSEQTIMQQRFGTDTQKCEAINRSISVSLPKNVNFSRNAMGRLSSTILRNNMGIAESTVQKAKILGVSLSSRTRRSLKQIDTESQHHKTYQTRSDVKRRNLLSRGRRYYEHSKYRQTKHSASSAGYRKGQLDPKIPGIFLRGGSDTTLQDHSCYTK